MADRRPGVPPAPRKPARHLHRNSGETSPPPLPSSQRPQRPLDVASLPSTRPSLAAATNRSSPPPVPTRHITLEPIQAVMGPPAPPPPHRPGYIHVLVAGGNLSELPHLTPAPSPNRSPDDYLHPHRARRTLQAEALEHPARRYADSETDVPIARPPPPGRSNSRLDYAVDAAQLGKAINEKFDGNLAAELGWMIVEEGGGKSPSPPPVPPYVPGPPAPYEETGKKA